MSTSIASGAFSSTISKVCRIFLLPACSYVLTDPSLLLARWLFYGFVVTRLLHFAAYFTAQTHDMRATLWTPGSLILIFMACRTLFAALGY